MLQKHQYKGNIHDEKIRQIADVDIDCKKELHAIQMENERKRSRNLDLEYEVIKAKLSFYTQRKTGLYFLLKMLIYKCF